MNLIYCSSQPVVWHLMSHKTLPVIGFCHKYELLLLYCLIIKRIEFSLWLLFIISKSNTAHRCLTLKTRRKFSCNTNTQTAQIHKCRHACPHTFPPLSYSISFALSHTQRHTGIAVSHSLVLLLFDLLGDL